MIAWSIRACAGKAYTASSGTMTSTTSFVDKESAPRTYNP